MSAPRCTCGHTEVQHVYLVESPGKKCAARWCACKAYTPQTPATPDQNECIEFLAYAAFLEACKGYTPQTPRGEGGAA